MTPTAVHQSATVGDGRRRPRSSIAVRITEAPTAFTERSRRSLSATRLTPGQGIRTLDIALFTAGAGTTEIRRTAFDHVLSYVVPIRGNHGHQMLTPAC
ncbi:hypothetical protein [Microlunatus ginsengisoli]|uniref:Uncharacterized protein n=1 Tax=Microlunatus ginsengisoli TaxID=363863 RepID=A0ABP7A1G8_9ACTN